MLRQLFNDTLHLFFPHHCAGCGTDALPASGLLCLRCIHQLPYTGYEAIANNPVENIFRGRLAINAGSSCFYFSKGHLMQHLIHELKYKGNKGIGEYMGALMGRAMLAGSRFTQVDYLVPLPLYADKEFKRGYNQSTILCKGISSVTQIPIMEQNVIRQHYTDTQTKKHRAERWENVAGSFAIKKPALLQGKKVLLVDDVITTGATLEACGQAMAHIPGIAIYISSLATASK